MRMNKTTRFLVMTAMMAALCMIATFFLRIEIPTPLGGTKFHLGDVFLLLSALLFGSFSGALTGAVGMSLADLLMGYALDAPLTFAMRFVQGFLCGAVAHGSIKNTRQIGPARSAVACALATATYIAMYLVKNFIEKRYLWEAELGTVLTDTFIKLGNSSIKAVINVIIVVLLLPVFRAALRRAGVTTAQ